MNTITRTLKIILYFIILFIINAFAINAYNTNLISDKVFACIFGFLVFFDLLTLVYGFIIPTWNYIQFDFSKEEKIYNFLFLLLILSINAFCIHVISNSLLSNTILTIIFVVTLLLDIITVFYYINIIFNGIRTFYGLDFENKIVKSIIIIFFIQIPFLVSYAGGFFNFLKLLAIECFLTIILLPIILLNFINIKREKETNENSNKRNEYKNIEERGNVESDDNNIYDEENGNAESVSNQHSFSKKDSDKEISYNNQSKLSKKLNNSKTMQIEYCPENLTPLENNNK